MPYVAPKVPTETEKQRQNKQFTARQNFGDMLNTVKAAYENLDKLGALPSSTKGSYGRNLMASAGASGAGQIVSGALGTPAQTERDTITNARFTLLNQLKDIQGIGSRQLDSNVELKNALTSLGGPGQSIETIRRTLETIGRIYSAETGESRGGGSTPAAKPAPGGAAAPLSDAEIKKRLGLK
jgi:hypothetical protein